MTVAKGCFDATTNKGEHEFRMQSFGHYIVDPFYLKDCGKPQGQNNVIDSECTIHDIDEGIVETFFLNVCCVECD